MDPPAPEPGTIAVSDGGRSSGARRPRVVRVLHLADTHLGFDLPFRPRVVRRRRGPDFFANTRRALAPALRGEVDLVVHGGDLLFRSKVPTELVGMALEPLLQVAEAGVPVFVVPGNHERGRIPLLLWTAHENFHVFDRPRTFTLETADLSLSVSGFPFDRFARDAFPSLLRRTDALDARADVRFLCMHQTVEGARVGPRGYTFRRGRNVVRGADIPGGFCAVLAGHIHRAQVLSRNLRGGSLEAPVVYPGSIERTSFAERDEEKGYFMLEAKASRPHGGRLDGVRFVPLPARPMAEVVLGPEVPGGGDLARSLRERLSELDPDAVVRVRVRGADGGRQGTSIGAREIRAIAPSSMNVTIAAPPHRRP